MHTEPTGQGPYIVIVERTSDERGIEILKRRAVATLDEACDLAQEAIDSGPPITSYAQWTELTTAADSIPATGGPVGPLPDGTTIYVEQLNSWDLANAVGGGGELAEIIAAYNARYAS